MVTYPGEMRWYNDSLTGYVSQAHQQERLAWALASLHEYMQLLTFLSKQGENIITHALHQYAFMQTTVYVVERRHKAV